MRITNVFLMLVVAYSSASAEEWIEIGADALALYYIDLDSIIVNKDSISISKKGIYNHTMTENLGGGDPRVFKQTLGVVEMDCELRLNRVVEIKMLDEHGSEVWTSGYMRNRPWEEVLSNTHAEKTLDLVCKSPNA